MVFSGVGSFVIVGIADDASPFWEFSVGFSVFFGDAAGDWASSSESMKSMESGSNTEIGLCVGTGFGSGTLGGDGGRNKAVGMERCRWRRRVRS